MTRGPTSAPLRVVVAGGGFAAGEALLALHALAGDRVSLELVTRERRLALRPASTALPFTTDAAEVESYDLEALCATAGASLRVDTVEAVAPAARRLRLASGATLDYDALVLALGARARVAVPGALTFRDQRDAALVRGVVAELRAGAVRRLAFAVPAGATWSLPVYELALQAAAVVDEEALAAEVTVATPEEAPLEIFGPPGATAVAELLADRGVRVVTGVRPDSVDHDGLRLGGADGLVPADRVVALAALIGRRVPGVPGGFSGFVPTTDRGRVDGVERMWAAGDMTDFPVKQGGIAAQQAEAAAADIAALAGAGEAQEPDRYVLRARLFGAGRPVYLRTELDALGRPIGATSVVDEEPPWWPPAKVVGRYLTPWMAEHPFAAA